MWGLYMNKKRFMTGSAQVKEEVLQKMAMPLVGHGSENACELQERVVYKLKRIFNTDEAILLSSFSGSGLMEGAVRSCTRKRAAIFSIGNFGNRWYEIATANNIPVDLYEIEWGGAINAEFVDEVLSTGKYDLMAITHNETSTGIVNPIEEMEGIIKKYPEIVWCVDAVSSFGGTKIEVDKLGIDICITSTEKALALPAGMSMCSFSRKAIERANKITHRGYYLDLLNIYEHAIRNKCQYPFTPAISYMYGLDYQLDNIIKEGLDHRYKRHEEMSKVVKNWAEKNFEIFGDKNHLSKTITVIKNTRNVNIEGLNKKLKERGFAISNGYGKLKEKTFGIGHMGDATVQEVQELLSNIDDIIRI